MLAKQIFIYFFGPVSCGGSVLKALTGLVLLIAFASTPGRAMSDEDLVVMAERFTPTAEETEAGAVILESLVDIKVLGEDRVETNERITIAILDERAAVDYTKISIGFNSYYDDMKLVSASLIDSGGKRYTVSPDAVQIKTRNNSLAYDDMRNLSFSLPSVRPGSLLRYHVRTTTRKPVIPGHWFSRYWFYHVQSLVSGFRMDPVRRARIQLDVSQRQEFKHIVKNLDMKPDIKNVEGRTYYTWETKNSLPGIEIEGSMGVLSDIIPTLYISSIPDWRSFDHWATSIYLDKSKATSAIEAKSREITGSTTGREEKIRKIYQFVQDNIRYIQADVKRGGMAPHEPEQILSNQYGDCKDQSVLLVSLLRAQGIEAYPALVGVFPQTRVLPELPMLYFSHMIVYVPNEHGGQWLDTSGNAGAFPGINWSLQNRQAFVIDGRGGHLASIPPLQLENNNATMDVAFSFQGERLVADTNMRFTGAIGDHLKAKYKFDHSVREDMLKSFNTMFTNGRTTDVKITPNTTSEEPFIASAQLEFSDIWSGTNKETLSYAGSLTTLLQLFSNLTQLPTAKDRTHDFKLNYGYRLQLNFTLASPPESYKPLILSGNDKASNQHFSYTRNIKEDNGVVHTQLDFTLHNPTVEIADYALFHQDIQDFQKRSVWQVTYKRNKHHQRTVELQNKVAEGPDSINGLLELARHYLMLADYDRAKELATQAVTVNPGNGEAHYLLGIALGFLDDYDASETALSKAKMLGYQS